MNITEALVSKRATIATITEHLQVLGQHKAACEAAFEKLACFHPELDVSCYGSEFEFNLVVKDIKVDGLAVLSFLERELGCTFGDRRDWAEYSHVEHTAKEYPLKVTFIIDSASENCKRVKVGEKVVPVYELQCGEPGEAVA